MKRHLVDGNQNLKTSNLFSVMDVLMNFTVLTSTVSTCHLLSKSNRKKAT